MASKGQAAGTISVRADERSPHVSIVTIANERKANALDAAMLDDLEKLVSGPLAKARAVVLVGAGDRHFCSGADINAWAPMTPEQFGSEWVARGNSIFASLAQLPAVVIAAINGTCFGGGLELALCADVRYAASTAKFAFPETGIGAVPGWLGGPMLSACVGPSLAGEMILGGKVVDAPDAVAAGLASKLCSQDKLLDDALDLARAAASRSPIANAAAKRLMNSGKDDLHAHELEGANCKASADGAEGLKAFAEKRKPNF